MNLRKIKYFVGKNLTFSQLKNRSSLSKLANTLNGKILDLGCGNGEYSLLMAENPSNEIIALEVSENLIKELKNEIDRKKVKNIEVVKGDAHSLSFPDNYFDAVFCNTVLEHVNEPGEVLNEIYRVLKVGGKLIVSIPFLQEIHADPFDFQRYTPYGLEYQLKKAKFDDVKIKGDFGAINAVEYLLLGSIVWRIRLGFMANFPFGYFYVFCLFFLFLIVKLIHMIFWFLQNKDDHFITQVLGVAWKRGNK